MQWGTRSHHILSGHHDNLYSAKALHSNWFKLKFDSCNSTIELHCISIQQPSCASTWAAGYPLDTPVTWHNVMLNLSGCVKGRRHIPAHFGDHIKEQRNKVVCCPLGLFLELLPSRDDQSLLGCTDTVSWKSSVPPFSLDHHICSPISCWISTQRHEGAGAKAIH